MLSPISLMEYISHLGRFFFTGQLQRPKIKLMSGEHVRKWREVDEIAGCYRIGGDNGAI